MTMGLLSRFFGPRQEDNSYEGQFLRLRDQVTDGRLLANEMLDAMEDDATTHMIMGIRAAQQLAATDPFRARQFMRLALAQGEARKAIVLERYRASRQSLGKQARAIEKAAQASRRALGLARPAKRSIEGADVRPVVKAPAPTTTPAATPAPRQRFDTDYAPATRNGKP